MPASDELDMFCIIIYPHPHPPTNHRHPLCTASSLVCPSLCLANHIFIDGEVLESMVALLRGLVSPAECVCVCVRES